MTAEEYVKAARGYRNREYGEMFEKIIEKTCGWYRENGIADIEKTPEPTKQLSKPNERGRFIACYEKKAQPDFKGTIRGGRSVVFDAKYTAVGKIKQTAVLPQQWESLDRHEKLGASCFVLVGFGMRDVRRVQWEKWKRMKEELGRKYMTAEDWPETRVFFTNGMPNFLGWQEI